jgi:tetratricopeptide (TPR) repeat protein
MIKHGGPFDKQKMIRYSLGLSRSKTAKAQSRISSYDDMQLYKILLLLLPVLPAQTSGREQSQGGRPALIRDTAVAEGKEEAEVSKETPFNPLEAEKSIKVGDFYFKKKNYLAAIQRYIEALQYHPNSIKGYEALGKAYEKQKSFDKALEIYRDFIRKNPSSPKVPEFQARVTQLEKKS